MRESQSFDTKYMYQPSKSNESHIPCKSFLPNIFFGGGEIDRLAQDKLIVKKKHSLDLRPPNLYCRRI